MVKKAYLLSILRLFKEQLGRSIALTAIAMVGIGFMAGLGPCRDKIRASASEMVLDEGVPDITAMSSSASGFTLEEYDSIRQAEGIGTAESFSFLEEEKDEEITRVYYYPFATKTLDELTLVSGVLPAADNEIVVLEGTNVLHSHAVGDVISFPYAATISLKAIFTESGYTYPLPNDVDLVINYAYSFQVVGVATSPEFIDKGHATSYTDSARDLSAALYLDSGHKYTATMSMDLPDSLPSALKSAINDYLNENYNTFILSNLKYGNGIHLSLAAYEERDVFATAYQKQVQTEISSLKTLLGDDSTVSFLSLEENAGIVSLEVYSQKLRDLSTLISFFFIAVVALVISSTMIRLVDEQRGQIACYQSLGFPLWRIGMKYCAFALLPIIVGALIGYLGLGRLVTYILYSAFSISYYMPTMVATSFPAFGIISTLITVLVSLVSCLYILWQTLREQPSELLLPKTPKAGKTIFLEKFPKLWDKILFSFKSSIRNLFRSPIRFAVTVITVGGSVILMVASLGIYDSSLHYNDETTTLLSSISIVLVAAAAALTILVLYNLTNITISERKREIATLMVLGYRDKEVGMSIYREVSIMVLIGLILGIPCGIWFTNYVFAYIDYGSIDYINWYSYLVIAGAVLLCSLVVDFSLYPKIKRTDMNGSLKSVE